MEKEGGTILAIIVVVLILWVSLQSANEGTLDNSSKRQQSVSQSIDSEQTVLSPNASFEIAISKDLCYVGEELSLSILNFTDLDEDSLESVSYKVIESDSIQATINENKTIVFNSPGLATIEATINGIKSNNTLTVQVIMNADYIKPILDAEFNEYVYLGRQIDIGLNDLNKDYYMVADADYVIINDEGNIEFIGIKNRISAFTLFDFNGDILYQTTYHSHGAFESYVTQYLTENEIISSSDSNIPNSMLTNIETLDLTGWVATSTESYTPFKYFTSLKSVNLSSIKCYDSTFLSKINTLEEVIINNNGDLLQDANNGISFYKALADLPSFKRLSLKDSIDSFDRELFNSLVLLIYNKNLSVEISNKVVLNKENVLPYSQTVFFSFDEYDEHIKTYGTLTPATGFSHAVFSFSTDTTEEHKTERAINTNKINSFDLYGKLGNSYRIKITSDGNLTINLYNFIFKPYYNTHTPINVSGILEVHARRGKNYIFGSQSVYVNARNSSSRLTPDTRVFESKEAIIAYTVKLYSHKDCSLTVRGGDGYVGKNGIADGSNPNDSSSAKWGMRGGDGAPAITASYVLDLSGGKITLIGGNGGHGGDGGDGSGVNIFNCGYDGGHGGDGGNGAPAFKASIFSHSTTCDYTIIHGSGGGGGEGGNPYALGYKGNSGEDGLPGA